MYYFKCTITGLVQDLHLPQEVQKAPHDQDQEADE